MENKKQSIKLIAPEAGESLAVAGGSYRIVVSGKETGGDYAVIEMLVPPGGGPGPHAHADFAETFHVLEGEIEVRTEDGTFTAGKGSFAIIPKGGLVHGFKNKKGTVARLWCVVTPAGLEGFFQEIAPPAPFGQFSAPPPMTREMGEKLTTIAAKYGQQVFPPDYLDK